MDYDIEKSTLVENPVTITEAGVRKLAKAAKGKIVKIYLHWTAGHYGHDYSDYHLCVDKDGTVYVNCDALTEKRYHTWLRNKGSIGIALCCAADARCWCPVAVSPRRVRRAVPEGEVPEDCEARINFGDEPPTEKQLKFIENCGIDPETVMNKGHAGMIITRIKSRLSLGLSTAKQIRLLERYGFVQVGTWSVTDATAMIGRLSSNGWRLPYGFDPKAYRPVGGAA